MSKQLYLLSTTLGVILTLCLLLLPSILLGRPQLIFVDHRLETFLVIVSFWVLADATGSNREYVQTTQVQAKWLPYLMSASMLLVLLASLSESALYGVSAFGFFSIIGAIAMSVGVLLRWLAIRTLGSFFLDEVAVVSGQSLVTTGIYHHCRHPSEMGNLCIAFGSSLLLGSLVGLALCICVVLPMVLIRIRLEDRLLMSHYPKQFGDYAKDVPALFPRF